MPHNTMYGHMWRGKGKSFRNHAPYGWAKTELQQVLHRLKKGERGKEKWSSVNHVYVNGAKVAVSASTTDWAGKGRKFHQPRPTWVVLDGVSASTPYRAGKGR